MRDFILTLFDTVADCLVIIGLSGLIAIAVGCLLCMVIGSWKVVYSIRNRIAIIPLILFSLIIGGTKPTIPTILIEWDEGLHDAGTSVDTNDLCTITFRWTYENWIPNIATVSIKAYEIHTVNPDPTVDRGIYVCNGVPITDRTAMVQMVTDATNYSFYVEQSYMPDAPVVTNGVYHIHSVGTNNVWIPIGLKILEDSRIISPHKGDNNEQ